MPELVPLDGARSRRRHRRGISATSDVEACIQCCITVAKGFAFGDDTRKRKASAPQAPIPYLSDEIVVAILVWLPVKSLLRCRAVCKAWRAIVNDPLFVSAHLRWSAMRWEQEPSFLVTPVTRDHVIPQEDVKERGWPTTFSKQISFYRYQWQWQQSASDSDSDNNGHGQQQTARLMHVKELGSKSNRVGFFAHCDGLVLAPTEKELYLLNPATGDAITLPKSHRNNLRHAPRTCHCVGLGLDPRTGKYKVFQAFYRPVNPYPRFNDYKKVPMGMEFLTLDGGNNEAWTWTETMEDSVFTLGSGDDDEAWTETREDPPRPLLRWQTGVTLKGFIFWRVDTAQYCQSSAGILLRLTLELEGFNIIPLPGSMRVCDDFMLDALHGQGELCLTTRTSDVPSVTIWMMPVHNDDNYLAMGYAQWELRYSIPLGLPPHRLCRLMALVAGGTRILLWSDFILYEYDLATSKLSTVCEMDRMRYQGRRTRKWKNLWSFNFVPYTESLFRIGSLLPVCHYKRLIKPPDH